MQSSSAAEDLKNDIERSTVMKAIKVKLTLEEISDRAKLAAENQKTVDDLTQELNEHKARLKPQIKAAEEELHRLLEVVEDGHEELTREVEMVKDFAGGIVRYFYDGKQVEQHELKEDDRQQTMPLPDSTVGHLADDQGVQEIIEEETNRNTKTDMVV